MRTSGEISSESRSGVSAEANSAATDRALALDRAALAQQPRQPAQEGDVGPQLLPPPAAGGGDREQRQLGRQQRRGEQRQQRAGVGADEEGEPVALEPEPLLGVGAELVVVGDHARRARSRPRAPPSAAAPRGRRPRGRGRTRPGSRRPRRQVRSGIARQAPEATATSPGRRRLVERQAVAPRPGDPGEVQRVAGGVDASPLAVGDQRLPGAPAALLVTRAGGSPRRSRAAARRRG